MTSTEEKDIPEVNLGEFVKHIGLDRVCCIEFPFLAQLLADAEST